jgi:hypothetical protein
MREGAAMATRIRGDDTIISKKAGGRCAALLAGLIAVGCWIAPAQSATPQLFDKPTKVVRQGLPKDPDNPQAKPELSCSYYPRFMVKQIDLGEPGADQLSILKVTGTALPPCKRANAADEIVIKEWSGYFKGVKGDYILFDADDGWNSGLGFAVTTPDGKKLFDDVAKPTLRGVELASDGTLTLRYTRVYGAPCSLRADAVGCWDKIKQQTGLADPAPDCKAAYEREMKRVPKFAKETIDDPTAVDYEAVTAIAGGTAKITAATGKALACRPED